MPILEYVCDEGHIVEQLLSRADADKREARTMPCYKCEAQGEMNIAERILSPTPGRVK